MSDLKSDIKGAVQRRVEDGAQGKVWSVANFVDLGSRDTVDKAVQRLANAGELRRIERGLYDRRAGIALPRPAIRPIRAA